jgi:bacteriorhodopsin
MVKLLEIWDRTGAVMVRNPAQDEVARLPLIVSMPLRVICIRSLPWMLTFPLMVLQLFNASAAAWDSMVKPLGDAQLSATTCQHLPSAVTQNPPR